MILPYVQDILDYFASKCMTGGLLQQVVGNLSLATSFSILGLSSSKDVPPSNTTIQEIEFNKLPPYILKRKKGEDTFNFLPRKAKFILIRCVDNRERSIAYLVTYPGRVLYTPTCLLRISEAKTRSIHGYFRWKWAQDLRKPVVSTIVFETRKP